MNKRLFTASIVVAIAAATAPAYAKGGGTSRSCLTAPARALLARIEARFGAMQIISTCRPGARIAGTRRISRHASGNAIDFNAGSRKAAVVNWLIANHKSGGTMTYRGMSHVHVDIGPHFVALGSGGRGSYRSSRRSYAAASNGRRLAGTRSGLGMSTRQPSAGRQGGGNRFAMVSAKRTAEASP